MERTLPRFDNEISGKDNIDQSEADQILYLVYQFNSHGID